MRAAACEVWQQEHKAAHEIDCPCCRLANRRRTTELMMFWPAHRSAHMRRAPRSIATDVARRQISLLCAAAGVGAFCERCAPSQAHGTAVWVFDQT